jgi:hypothetical protein
MLFIEQWGDIMSETPVAAQIAVFGKASLGSPEPVTSEENCNCTQGRIDASALLGASSSQRIMASFDPHDIKTISDFVRLSDSVKQ